MSKVKIEDYSFGKPFGSYTLHEYSGGDYKEGYFISYKHTVRVYAQDGYISMSIYEKGRGYHKTIRFSKEVMPSDLSLSRQASKFSKELEQGAFGKEIQP